MTVEPRVVKVYTQTSFRAIKVPTHVEPRDVEEHDSQDPQSLPDRTRESLRRTYAVSRTPVPATLQTCHEARSLGLYQKCFSEIDDTAEDDERRYVWLNFDIDMLDFFDVTSLSKFLPFAEPITRISFKANTFAGTLTPFKGGTISKIFQYFPNLKEAHIRCCGGAYSLASWFFATHLTASLRSREDIKLLDMDTGRWYTARELDDIGDRQIRGGHEGAGTSASDSAQSYDPGAFHLDLKIAAKIRQVSPRYMDETAHP